MNEKMKKLMKKINDKKNEVKSLVAEDKMDEAREAKEELKGLQEKFDLLCDLEDEALEDVKNQVAGGTARVIDDGNGGKAGKENLVRSFVNIVKAGFLGKQPDEKDVEVYQNALTSDPTPNDEGESGIGVTIPEDIRLDIIGLRRDRKSVV